MEANIFSLLLIALISGVISAYVTYTLVAMRKAREEQEKRKKEEARGVPF